MVETVDRIVESSDYPMSIIFLGIGSSNFVEMDKFDDRLCKLISSQTSLKAKRCNVQFAVLDRYSDIDTLYQILLKTVANQFSEFFENEVQEAGKKISFCQKLKEDNL